ncbi:hypothetical protein R1flu_007135 [Riccia fluitans]|uniref:Glyoxalase/fosfomycin resistance/dioxygenase domain-containing protein n=1 Tax=Riccia fluitans TaxID=41844 RepID=A0ABD1YXZ7_9MARC
MLVGTREMEPARPRWSCVRALAGVLKSLRGFVINRTDRGPDPLRRSATYHVIMEVLRTIPILRIFDLTKAREFYIDYLGFQVDWEHTFEPGTPTYMQVSRAGCILHLTEHHGDSCPGSTVFIKVTGLQEFHKELSDKQYPFMRPGIEMMPHKQQMYQILSVRTPSARANLVVSSISRI